jgi:uncharacterized protein
MKNFIYQNQWGWLSSGIALGIIFLLTVAFVKPIGVSTQFVILDGIIWDFFSDQIVVEDNNAKNGYSSSNAYLNKSGGKYAKNIAHPFNYSFIFVLAMIAGGFIAGRLQSGNNRANKSTVPIVWIDNYGPSPIKRYIIVFTGGFLALFGARLAGGCTSGHMMSGMMQTSLSGYLFAMGTFAVAVPVAMFMYKGGK